MNDISLDIETMDKASSSAIISISACYFNRYTGDIGETFHKQVDLQSSIDAGLTVSASTLIWWLKQNEEARSKFFDNEKQRPLKLVLDDLSYFIGKDSQVWGNGATFDNVIVENAFKAVDVEVPWEFWNMRCLRTLVETGLELGIDPKKDLPFEGVRHDALSDAIHQAKVASTIFMKINEVKTS